jgi:hypothetical protein
VAIVPQIILEEFQMAEVPPLHTLPKIPLVVCLSSFPKTFLPKSSRVLGVFRLPYFAFSHKFAAGQSAADLRRNNAGIDGGAMRILSFSDDSGSIVCLFPPYAGVSGRNGHKDRIPRYSPFFSRRCD